MGEPTWPQAGAIARLTATPLLGERVPLADAHGRTLSEPITALHPLPGFDTAAMDGWAVCGPGPWQVVGTVLAGSAPPGRLQPATAVGIATGAAVPVGATGIVKREDGVHTGDVLAEIDVPIRNHIRPKGEECQLGEVLSPAGKVVGPADVGVAAAAGNDGAVVVAVPRVRLLLLGDELVESGIPSVGRVRDSLGPQLPGWIARLGGAVVDIIRVPDTVGALTAALAAAAAGADLLMTTGGTAAGPVDCLHESLAELGAELLVDGVAVRPGHPMLLAKEADLPIVGLPGNPQSAIVGLMTLGAPLLRGMLGRPEPDLEPVTLSEDLSAPAHEHRLVLGTVRGARFAAADHLGSAMLRGLAAAAGFAVVPPGGATSNDAVAWLPLP